MHRQTDAATQPDRAFRSRSICTPRNLANSRRFAAGKPWPIVPQHPVMPHPLLKLGTAKWNPRYSKLPRKGYPGCFFATCDAAMQRKTSPTTVTIRTTHTKGSNSNERSIVETGKRQKINRIVACTVKNQITNRFGQSGSKLESVT